MDVRERNETTNADWLISGVRDQQRGNDGAVPSFTLADMHPPREARRELAFVGRSDQVWFLSEMMILRSTAGAVIEES
ncbi:hypothetical protein NJI34_20745 [Pseudomonas sp. S 311-6]|uniref:Uncharacterized protein n=1 Tax=Kerstersia gyiorum TaxID=206506 RepID=A0A171KVB1_9BURK|nr:hypothetical protein AAV32_00195 [Kerstersia gyiorum]MCO7639195.1 hypothetical protein [Pseudomonas sp. S 311-6]